MSWRWRDANRERAPAARRTAARLAELAAGAGTARVGAPLRPQDRPLPPVGQRAAEGEAQTRRSATEALRETDRDWAAIVSSRVEEEPATRKRQDGDHTRAVAVADRRERRE